MMGKAANIAYYNEYYTTAVWKESYAKQYQSIKRQRLEGYRPASENFGLV